jgi:hypothetical protein
MFSDPQGIPKHKLVRSLTQIQFIHVQKIDIAVCENSVNRITRNELQSGIYMF